ncbi:MAG: FAD-binding protein, partial [Flavobacterium sp.]|nr:FAD-binding protein [Flavobacterium sp.]
MQIHEHFSLKNYNSFGINVYAKQFIAVQSVAELSDVLIEFKDVKKFILGGGSNMLLTQNIDALVILIDIKGKTINKQNDNYVWITCNAGENWHEFVLWTIYQNFGGLENL